MSNNYWDQDTSETFEKYWVNPYGLSMQKPFEDMEPALRFGWNRALASEYPNETWEEVEEDLERAWKNAHPEHGIWAEIKKHVQDAWMKAHSDWQGLASKVKQG